MTTITLTQINKAKKSLEDVTRQAKHRLFEFETITNLYEIQNGKSTKHKTSKSFMQSLTK